MSDEPRPFGVYIHIPFCRSRCPYCDFVSQAIPDAPPDAFVRALVEEIRAFEGPRKSTSVFLGGGTPSLLTATQLETILEAIRSGMSLEGAEITLEANPDDVTSERARTWGALGINRISLGVQSFDDQVLQYLGRRHDADRASQAAAIIAGEFWNWNMDLIFGAAPLDTWEATVQKALLLEPPHIAVYGLTYEPDTPFGARAAEGLDDDDMLQCYQLAEQALAVYEHYEISNYARPGFQCRHNLLYWHNNEYAGFGPGAYAYGAGKRMRNTVSLQAYLHNPGHKVSVEVMTMREQAVETLIQHFRLRTGIRDADFRQRFGVSLNTWFRVPLEMLQKRGLLCRDGDRWYPSQKGFYLNNEIGLALVDTCFETTTQTNGPGQ